MKRAALLYGLIGGCVILALRAIEYRYIIIDYSVEIYGGLIALVFVVLGLWLGRTLAERSQHSPSQFPSEPSPANVAPVNPASTLALPSEILPAIALPDAPSLTKREHEILALIADGLSNREIAERLFVSENTVKTHSKGLFEKLKVSRRTQAVQAGQRLGLLPTHRPTG